ncbi:unnamed protein product [marine sediment metagenome]|uniref:Uncharacterized protein n=1 Tax=marine sediment metagenome TaxID=412755 RepID=X0WCC5_9ZZZZ
MRQTTTSELMIEDKKIPTGPLAPEQVTALVNDNSELIVCFDRGPLEQDESRLLIYTIHFNRLETAKIRTVLEHTE